MLVYGDLEIVESSDAVLASLSSQIDQIENKTGLSRHEAISDFLMSAGALAQFLLDQENDDELEDILTHLLLESASWFYSSFQRVEGFDPSDTIRLLNLLKRRRLPKKVRMKIPEGFAFYSLFPEMIIQAGEKIKREYPDREWVVIGIRSIGTVLAPLLSIVLGARETLTVRPKGEPFDRKLSIGENQRERILIRDVHYAIVDEGPGLSGSSFASVAQWLFEHYVLPEQVHFFPSHAQPPGAFVTSENLRIWQTVKKECVEFERLRTQAIPCWPFRHLKHAKDISGGLWRTMNPEVNQKLPPIHPFLERRKYWSENSKDGEVAKFVGLGRIGTIKKKMAISLSNERWIPRVHGVEYGWVTQEWHRWPSLFHSKRQIQLDALATVAEYLVYRNHEFKAPSQIQGASIADLFTMIQRNLSLAFGEERVTPFLSKARETLSSIQNEAQPILTDGRLHLWEWLRSEDGQLLKCDAFDHSLSHDLIGPQDVAWDIAGAMIEFDLSASEQDLFLSALSQMGVNRRAPWVDFMKLAYLSFQLGYYSLAAQSVAGDHPDESDRLQARSVWLQFKIESDFLSNPIHN